jgi:hypothetical protein
MVMENVSLTKNTAIKEQRPVICLVGTLRSLHLTYQNLIEKLIQPLDADLIVCVSRMDLEDEAKIGKFKDCNIIDVYIYDVAQNGYQDYLRDFFSTLNLEQQAKWEKYLKIDGNWLGGIEGRKGSGFHLNFNYSKLSERLKYLAERGLSYQRAIITRTDLLWLVEHPSLNLLDSNFIWTPTGENYNGHNDRHAVCSRNNIFDYLSLHDFMINFKALEYIQNDLDGNNLNHERHLKSHLDHCGVKVSSFKSVAYLTGDRQSHTNWGSVKYKCINGVEYAYKYESELLAAIKNKRKFEYYNSWEKLLSDVD